MKKLLPLGSVVLLSESTKRVMITGRYQRAVGPEGRLWDYSACLFPEGNLGPDQTFLFNNEQIERVYFLGLQDEEEFAYLGELALQAPDFMESAEDSSSEQGASEE